MSQQGRLRRGSALAEMIRTKSAGSDGKPTNSDPLRSLRRTNTRGSLAAESSSSTKALPANRHQRRHSTVARDFIKVVARIRPKLQNEVKVKSGVEAHRDGKTLIVRNERGDARQFCLDQIFDSQHAQGSQAEVFATFGRELVNHSLKGYNVCIFAYGHTGTGKTYTMLGDHAAQCNHGEPGEGTGLLPRFLGEVFQAHKESEGAVRNSRHYTCEYYEVYNEQIKDLLLPTGVERTRRVHVHPRHGVRIENLTTSVVKSAAEALQLVAFGNQMRAVAATTMNARSSRSHAIFTFRHEVTEETESLAGGDSCSSTVTLVDLAGREDQAVSRNKRDQFREMCFINTSLFHLTHLITKLADVPASGGSLSDFRNSKLTLLLSPALIGNSRTALVATVAPGQNFYEDSVSTMQFATSVKKIQTRPLVNNKTSNVLVAELEAEVKQLQQELAMSKTHEAEKEQALLSAQAIISGYRRSWDDLMEKSDEHRMIRQGSLASVGIMDNPHPGFGAIPRDASGRYLPFLTKLCDDPPLQGHCNFFLHQRPVTGIGSDPEVCHIILEGLGITACMCEVHCTNNEVEVRLHCGEGGPQGGTGCTGGLSSMASLFGSSSMGTRVIVNGRPLSFAEPERKLRHGDCLFLGYAHAFRLVNPCELESFKMDDEPIDAPSLVRATIQNLDTSSAAMQVVDETGTQFNAILPFISHLSSRTTKDKVQAFMKALHCVCPLVDEANIITAEVLPTDGIRLELHALTDVFKFSSDFPELVVAVLQEPHCRSFLTDFIFSEGDEDEEDEDAWSSPAPSPMSSPKNNAEGGRERHPLITAMGLQSHMKVGGQENLLYVWSLEKFLWRLTGMRDVYQEGSEMKDGFRAVRRKMAAQPFRNPWRETTFADVQLMAETVMLARSASHTVPNPGQPSQPPASSAPEDDGRGHTSEDPTPQASRGPSLSPGTRVRTPFIVGTEDGSAQGEIDSDQPGTSSGPPAVIASIAAATQDSGSISTDNNPFTSSRSLPDDLTAFRSIDTTAAAVGAVASAERSANASSPPSRDSAMPTATESDSVFAGVPKHNMEVEQLCAEVLQLQKAVLNWPETSIPRGPRQMLREEEKYTPRTDRKEQDGDQAQLLEAADSDSPLRRVMPEIRQRLVEMDMLQKRLKDDANVKSYSEGHESLHKLEKMRVNLAKLVRQGLQDHMQNLSGRPGTSSMPCSGTSLKKPRGQRASLRAEVTSPVRQATAPPRSNSGVQTSGPEDVLVYCPASRPQSARRAKGKAYRSSSMPERLSSQASRGSASASSRPASKDPPAAGNVAAGPISGAAPLRAAGPASAPAPPGGIRPSRCANPAAFIADMSTEQQSMAGPAIPYRQVGGFPLSVRRMREPVKAPIPFPACNRVPFTPRQDKRDPRLPVAGHPATAVASPQMAARASSTGCTPSPMRPVPRAQDPQSATTLGGGMPGMVFASAPPGPPPRGSIVSAAGAPVAQNAGSFVSGPSIMRSESVPRIPQHALSSSSQTVVPPSVPPLQPSAGDSPTSSSPKRTRHFIGPYPRVTWAYYEVTDPPSEALEPVVAKPASYTAPAPAPPHAMP